MLGYFITLTILLSFTCGHALASYQCTREWFYKYAFAVFGIFSVLLGYFVLYKGVQP